RHRGARRLLAHPDRGRGARRGRAREAARGGSRRRGARGRRARARGRVPADHAPRGARAVTGFPTLLYKEVLGFWKVRFHTVAAPVLSSLLYLLVFAHALADHVQAFPGVSYVQFLIPGLAMMAVLQNAFANSSSSIIQSKITGNIVFILLPPMGPLELFG